MRIAVAASGLGRVARGIESWASDLGRALAARGLDVRLCKAAGALEARHDRVIPCLARDSQANGFVRRLLPPPIAWRIGLGSGYGVEQASFAFGLLNLLRRERVDVLHVQDPLLALIAQGARRIGLIRAETVLAHGTEESPEFLGRIRFLQHLAPWHLEQARLGGFARETWTAIPNFVDVGAFRPGRAEGVRAELGIPPDALVVLTVAAIKRDHKRIDHLLREFARLAADRPELPAVLVVAGAGGSDTAELVAEGSALLGDRVRFLVGFSRARMPELYQAADVFTLASLMEMMPIAILEAMAGGLPCLVHRHPVLSWIVGAGGLAIDMEEPGALARALAGLLDDPARREAVGALAANRARDEFSADRITGRILDYYDYALAVARPGVGLLGVARP